MPNVMIKDDVYDTSVTSASNISARHPALRAVDDGLEFMNRTVPLDEFKVKRQGVTTKYDYTFKAKDGREWNQVMDVSPGQASATLMSFDVEDFWLLGEFSMHRPVREAVIEILASYDVQEIRVKWS